MFGISKEKNHIILKLFNIKISVNTSNKENNIYIKQKDGTLKKVKEIEGLEVDFRTSNSKVILHEPLMKFVNCRAYLKDNCTLEIGAMTKNHVVGINHVFFSMPEDNASIKIGDNLYFDKGYVYVTKDSSLTIGNDCMISSHVKFMVGEGSHTIRNSITKEVYKGSGDTTIGDRVWIGLDSTVLKNVKVMNDSIIGTRSVVTRKFDESNVVIAGSPAKIVKRNVEWEK